MRITSSGTDATTKGGWCPRPSIGQRLISARPIGRSSCRTPFASTSHRRTSRWSRSRLARSLPGGDGRNDRVTARYRVDEPATVLLTVNGEVRVRRRGQRTRGRVQWPGTVDGARVPQGIYRVALEAHDRAGNPGRSTRPRPVVVRYIALVRRRVEVAPGKIFSIRVLTDVPSYRWRFAGRTGRALRAEGFAFGLLLGLARTR